LTRRLVVRAAQSVVLLTVAVVGVAASTHATVVNGSFTGTIVEVALAPFPVNFGDPISGSFVYDTAVAINSSADPRIGDFTLPSGAALSVTVEGLTFSTSTNVSPMLARVVAPDFPLGDSLFRLASAGPTPDPSNPLPNIVPRLSLLGQSSGIPFTTGALPTSDFLIPISQFSDPDGWLMFASPPIGPRDILRFHVTTLSLVAVPEPATAAMLGVALVVIAAIRGGRSRHVVVLHHATR
jgi:hypothetical protein